MKNIDLYVKLNMQGGQSAAFNNVIGSSMSIDKASIHPDSSTRHQVIATVQGMNAVTDIGSALPPSMRLAQAAAKGSALFAVIQLGLKITDPNFDPDKDWGAGDWITLGAAAATVLGLGPVAIGLSIAGLGYTLFDLAKNGYSLPDNNPHKNLPRENNAHGYDPLILNLDGKGIQVTKLSATGARFDHDADGIATATGWAAKGNGILALDLNGNGLIDNGTELFGDNTRLANGQNATYGYSALIDLDWNADGIINSLDKTFNQLRVWQDVNQDGISQSNELFTLPELGIQSLNLKHQETNQDLGNSNRLTHIGTYTKTDGTTGEMGDVVLANDALYSRHTKTIELTPEQLQAPNLQGIGRLRDLREAAALSDDLAQVLKNYHMADTKQAQMKLLSDLIEKWGATDPQKSPISAFKLSSDLILTENQGIGLTPTQIAEWRKGIVLDAKTKADFEAVRGKIAVLDAFTGEKSETLYFGTHEQARQIIDTVNKTYNTLAENIYQGLLFQTRLQPYLDQIGFKLNDKQEFIIDYTTVKEKFQQVFQNNAQKAFVDLGEFLASSSLKDWHDGMNLLSHFAEQGKAHGKLQDWLNILGDKAITILTEQSGSKNNDVLQSVGLLGRDVLNGYDGNDRLIIGKNTAIVNGGNGSDIYEFHQGFGATTIFNADTSAHRHDVIRLHGVQKNSISYTRHDNDLIIHVKGEKNTITVRDMFAGDVLTQHIDAIEYQGGKITLQEIKKTLLTGTHRDDFLQGYGDDDVVHAGAGNDRIHTYQGNDVIYAGAGNDNIDAGSGNDKIYLETGINRAYGGDGDDTIFSGSLNDKLEGGMGSDTYVFGQTFGQDTVLNFNPNQQDTDVLKFTHTRLSDVSIYREASDLQIVQRDGQQVTVQNFFEKDGKGDYTVQSIQFSDGKSLNTEQILKWVMTGKARDDILTGTSQDDIITDHLGNDILNGGAGHDILDSGVGNDVLIGGLGNDLLMGGLGSDTYIYNAGDGRDVIRETGGRDVLQINHLKLSDLIFQQHGADLWIGVKNSTDGIIIDNHFQSQSNAYRTVYSQNSQIETIIVDNQPLYTHHINHLVLEQTRYFHDLL